MRSVDERCAAVRGRERRLRRRRNDRVLTILICLMALPLVDLVGRTATAGMAESPTAAGGLFGAASLFGSSIGGCAFVALITAVVVALITVLCVRRRRLGDDGEGFPGGAAHSTNETNSQIQR